MADSDFNLGENSNWLYLIPGANVVKGLSDWITGVPEKGDPRGDYYRRYIKELSERRVTPSLSWEQFAAQTAGVGNLEGTYQQIAGAEMAKTLVKQYNDLVTQANELGLTQYTKNNTSDYTYANIADLLENITAATSDIEKKQTTVASDAAKAEEAKYKFTMPEEWTTLGDWAKSTMEKGKPEYGVEGIYSFMPAAEKLYAGKQSAIEKRARDMWANIFPMGGGSGTQVTKNLQTIADLESEKLGAAEGMYREKYRGEVGDFEKAQQMYGDIGAARIKGSEFGSDQAFREYMAGKQNEWDLMSSLRKRGWDEEDSASQLQKLLDAIGSTNTGRDTFSDANTAAQTLAMIAKLFMGTPPV